MEKCASENNVREEGEKKELYRIINPETIKRKKLLYPAVTHNSGVIYKNVLKQFKYKFVSKFSSSPSCEKS
jgi:hypothetical protein